MNSPLMLFDRFSTGSTQKRVLPAAATFLRPCLVIFCLIATGCSLIFDTDAGNAECVLNRDCANLGDSYICRKKDQKCVNLLSNECTSVAGEYSNDNAIVFGAINVMNGTTAGIPRGLPRENAAKLAITDFNQTGSAGLPPAPSGTQRRPLAIVACTAQDAEDHDVSEAAATHLVDVGVPAIIGPQYSGQTIQIANRVTIPGQTLLIAPSATSMAITDLVDNGLVWRTAPSDRVQAQGLLKLVDATIKKIGKTGKIKIAVAYKSDAYGKGLAEEVEKYLLFNDGKSAADNERIGYYKRLDYGAKIDTDKEKMAQTVADPFFSANGSGTAPDIILILGTDEGTTQILAPLELAYQKLQDRPKPYYILADGSLSQVLPNTINSTIKDITLVQRIRGTIPGVFSSDNFFKFKTDYNNAFKDGSSPEVFGAAGAYDAVYLLAYAAVAVGDDPITGPNLASGMKKLVPPGQTINVGWANIGTAFQALKNGEQIDFNGASGQLDFDLEKGEAPSDIQIWCMPVSTSSSNVKSVAIGRASGQYLSGANTGGGLQGVENCD